MTAHPKRQPQEKTMELPASTHIEDYDTREPVALAAWAWANFKLWGKRINDGADFDRGFARGRAHAYRHITQGILAPSAYVRSDERIEQMLAELLPQR